MIETEITEYNRNRITQNLQTAHRDKTNFAVVLTANKKLN